MLELESDAVEIEALTSGRGRDTSGLRLLVLAPSPSEAARALSQCFGRTKSRDSYSNTRCMVFASCF